MALTLPKNAFAIALHELPLNTHMHVFNVCWVLFTFSASVDLEFMSSYARKYEFLTRYSRTGTRLLAK